jgi:microtubule-associated protein-like 6
LEWVHGYRSHDCKNNIGFASDGNIAYHAAGVGVVYDQDDHQQKFFREHIDDITAMAFSPDGKTVATGEVGPKCSICIWDATTMQLKHKLKGKLKKGIQDLAFSPSGKVLAGCAIDDNHYVAAYDVESGACLGCEKGDTAFIFELAFKNDKEFATAGVKHFKNWTIGSNLTGKRGNFGKKDMRVGSVKESKGDYLSGAITGEMYVWSGTSIKKSIKLHERPLDAITVTEQFILTGGRDGLINVIQAGTYNPLFKFNIDAKYESINNPVRAIAINESNSLLAIGTQGSEIYTVPIDMSKKKVGAPTVVTQGHYSPCKKDNNEVWGLCAFPNKDQYVSVSDDSTLRVWDTKTRKQVKCVKLNVDQNGADLPIDPSTKELANSCKARSVDISKDGKFAAIGFRDGSFRMYHIDSNWKMVAKKRDRKRWIQAIKFSPNGRQLAVGSHDGYVDIYDATSLDLFAKIKGGSSFITHMDWSQDSQTMKSNDASYEILYYNIASKAKDPHGASAYKDEHWATWSCILGWTVQGIFSGSMDGSDINGVARTKQPHKDGYHLVATADDFSKVKVFRYPSMVEESDFVEGTGHSSHVTMVYWSRDDQWLFSAGGNDTCIFQWKLGRM